MTDKNDAFVQALGKVPSGLFIVTAASGDQRAGFLASFVQQASFDPLVFSIAVHPDRFPYTLMKESKKFAINIIPEGDKVLMKTFAKGHGPDEDLVGTVDFEDCNGVPILKDAIGSAVCEIVSETQPGDHMIVFGKAVAGNFFQEDAKPWVHTRKSAMSY